MHEICTILHKTFFTGPLRRGPLCQVANLDSNIATDQWRAVCDPDIECICCYFRFSDWP